MLAREFILCLLVGMCVYFHFSNLCNRVCFPASTSGKFALISLFGGGTSMHSHLNTQFILSITHTFTSLHFWNKRTKLN